ncbi:hypothetical protein J4436_00145 [Candidatus Woesearchaeota archaeon]|nr:hypothetical protein [Candidatus Woesearchaeota archaeon]
MLKKKKNNQDYVTFNELCIFLELIKTYIRIFIALDSDLHKLLENYILEINRYYKKNINNQETNYFIYLKNLYEEDKFRSLLFELEFFIKKRKIDQRFRDLKDDFFELNDFLKRLRINDINPDLDSENSSVKFMRNNECLELMSLLNELISLLENWFDYWEFFLNQMKDIVKRYDLSVKKQSERELSLIGLTFEPMERYYYGRRDDLDNLFNIELRIISLEKSIEHLLIQYERRVNSRL